LSGTASTPIVAVLDNEPLQAVADPTHSKHRELMKLIEAVTQRGRRAQRATIVVSTVVRLEAGLNRQGPAAALLGNLRVRDEELTAGRADRAVALSAAASGTPADAATAQLAEQAATSGAKVTIYTSDRTDLPALIDAMNTSGVRLRHV
jgi:hypothetical protein